MDKKLNNCYRISLLITKHLLGQTTSHEETELKTWMESSSENTLIYNRWMKRLASDLVGPEPTDSIQAWGRLDKKLSRISGHRMSRLPRWSYGAAACMLILMGIFWFTRPTSEPPITPGSEKAILIASEGEEIQLDETPFRNLWQPKSNNPAHTLSQVMNNDGILNYTRIEMPAHENRQADFHTLRVPRGGEYQVILSDGTHIWLNSDTRLYYPVAFAKGDSAREVYMTGEAYFQVAHNPTQPFRVHLPDGTIQVSGTSFNARAYPDEPESVITLEEGRIAYRHRNRVSPMLPGEQIVYSHSTGLIRKKEVDVSEFSSWRNGLFEFNAMPLESIMKQLARWYDVKYRFEQDAIRMQCFTGVAYRKAPLLQLLQQIEKTTNIHFQIKGREIIVYQ